MGELNEMNNKEENVINEWQLKIIIDEVTGTGK